MDIKTTTGSGIVAHLRDGKRSFPLLAVEDLGDLQAHVPGEDQRFVTIFELHKWAQTPAGCDEVILASLRRDDPTATIEQARAVDTALVNRVRLARAIMSESLMSGEEAAAEGNDNAPKAGGTGTG